MNLLSSTRRRYKGNLHMHSTKSDGRRSPADAVSWFRQAGYDFVAFTDHYVVIDVSQLSSDGFLAMWGVELCTDKTVLGQSYHLVVLGLRSPDKSFPRPVPGPIQNVIDEMNSAGAAVILAHPYWSGLTVNEMMPLEGLLGVEVFNTSANRDLGKALSAVQWDDTLARGKQWWGLAVDDTHWIDDDAGGGWVMVEADTLSEEAILAALRAGRFYSSSGPDILDLQRDGDTVSVRCSPVATINFVGHTQWGAQRRAEPGGALTEASYRLRGNERYLRVECSDAQGRTAWSNPIYL